MAHTMARAAARQSRFPRSFMEQSPELYRKELLLVKNMKLEEPNRSQSSDQSFNEFSKNDYLLKMIKDLEDENRELKENLEFATHEMDILKEESEKQFEKERQEKTSIEQELISLREEMSRLMKSSEEKVEKERQEKSSIEEELRTLKEEAVEQFEKNLKMKSSLDQELASTRQTLAKKEELLQVLAGKYTRHRQVWEENEKKANCEIRKLDEVLDRVILTLSANDHIVGTCPQLKELLTDLTRDTFV